MAAKKTKDRMPEIESILGRAKSLRLNVGFPQDSSRREGGVDNATLGYIHEHGSPARNIPARPFLVPGIESREAQLVKVLEDGIKRALKTFDADYVDEAFERTGIAAVAAVQRYMVTGRFAPLKAETIRRKGSSRPLIDTGQLRASITYEVRNG